MTPTDLRTLCTALGFTAVVIKDSRVKADARKAVALARLIESFCVTTLPDAPEIAHQSPDVDSDSAEIDRAIDRYKAELRDKQEARLPPDRDALLKFYDRLLQRQARRQRQFYATGADEMIANRVVQLVDEEISSEEESA